MFSIIQVYAVVNIDDEQVKKQMSESKKRILKSAPSLQDPPVSKRSAKEIIEEINKLIEPIIESQGFELVHVEFQRESGGKILRIYLDKPGGIRLDDCVDINRDISDILDIKLEDTGPYRLEVSSPGLDRPLSCLKDYERFKGEKVKIRTEKPVSDERPNQKNFRGIIEAVTDKSVKVMTEGGSVDIPYSRITKGNLDPDF